MAKKDAKPVSFRLKDGAKWALDDLALRWECTQTKAVERALLLAHGGSNEIVPSGRMRSLGMIAAQAQTAALDAASIPGVSQGMPTGIPDATQGHCVHHNGPFQIPEGAKKTSICRKCFSRGHQNVESCKKCAEDEHFRKQAEASTSCEPEGIEFNMDWGA